MYVPSEWTILKDTPVIVQCSHFSTLAKSLFVAELPLVTAAHAVR